MASNIRITLEDLKRSWPDQNGRTSDEAHYVMDALNAVYDTPGGLEFMKTYVPTKGFMFSDHPTLHEIGSKIDRDGTIGHSGSSYGWTMRQVQYICRNGFNAYKVLRAPK